ncbi:DUF6114 domain-containing protein, partial [Microbacterium ulmi]
MRAALAWARRRPSIGGLLTVLSALVLFFSGRLEVGGMEVQVGMPGMQTTILPVVLAVAGALAVVMPAHHVFYGVVVLAASLYSLVAVNLGGYVVGMVLGCVGGIVIVSWMPRRAIAAGSGRPAPGDEAPGGDTSGPATMRSADDEGQADATRSARRARLRSAT